MTITDVPESGIYFQQNSIVQIVITIVDINTGEPIPLQTAINLKIDILYPDRGGWRSFVAALYTDGADGKIAYTTINDDAGYADLNQAGLYVAQGRVRIGGVDLPPSLRTDFYVLPNVPDQINFVEYPILKDSAGKFWQVYILPTGNLDTLPISNPPHFSDFIYLVDTNGVNWSLSVLPGGQLDTNGVDGPIPENQKLYLADATKRQWVVTITPPGNLKTS